MASAFGQSDGPEAPPQRPAADDRRSRGRRGRRARSARRARPRVELATLRSRSMAMASDLLAQARRDLGRPARRRRGPRCAAGAAMSTGNSVATRPGRLVSSTIAVAQAGRLAHVVGDEQDRPAGLPARSAPARRAGCRGSWRRARRRARPSAGRRPPARGPGPGRRAGACRPTARGAACRRSASAGPARAARRRARPALALGHARAAAAPARRCCSTREPREQRGLLEHERRARPRTSTVPLVGVVEPGDQVEQRGLAAAGRADEAHELAAAHGQRDVRRGRVTASPPAREHLASRDRSGRPPPGPMPTRAVEECAVGCGGLAAA